MKQTWRWFGPNDQVSIDDMLQAGVEGVVTSLHDHAPGQVWTRKAIAHRKAEIAVMLDGSPSGLSWDVVESLPVSESIKLRGELFESHVEAYCTSLENLAAEGIRVVCYNFMPLLDWTRTDIAKKLYHGGTAMSFDLIDFALFDLCILKRTGASTDYSQEVRFAAIDRFKKTSEADQDKLTATIIEGLPGAAETLTLSEFEMALKTYVGMDASKLRQNFKGFLEAVIPTAERVGVKLCCHPDDPPWPILGLPRIVSTYDDIDWFLKAFDSEANGLTFCSGSLGARADNDLPKIARNFADRIYFAHLRNVKRESADIPTSFFEDAHLDGSTDMIEVLKALKNNHPNFMELPMRPDHGQDILSDVNHNSAPGYPLCGRMKGLAELRGALTALLHSSTEN